MIRFFLPSRVDLLLLLVAVAWGSTYFVAKDLVSAGSVAALLAVRMLLAAAALAAIAASRRGHLTGAELRTGVVLGLLLAGVFAFETFGIAHTTATNAGLIISLTIVFTPVLDAAVSRSRLPGSFLLAATVAVTGVGLLAGNGSLRPPALGDLLILIAAVVRAVHVVSMSALTRTSRAGRPMDSLHLTTVQLGTCAVIFSALSLIQGESIPHFVSRLGLRELALLGYLVLGCTVFAFLVQTWAVRRTSPARVSLLLGTEPIWAALIGVGIAGDRLTPAGGAGMALILIGVAWGRAVEQGSQIEQSRRRHDDDETAPLVPAPERPRR